MGEHDASRGRDVRFGAALWVTVASGFVVAAACAWLLVAGRSDGDDENGTLAACGQLCAPDPSDPSASPRASSSSSPPSRPSSGSGPVVRFTVTSHWDSGYHADMTVVNTTRSPMVGWRLEFQVSGAQLQEADNSQAAQTADRITVGPAAWNGTIAPGGSVVLGFMFAGTLRDPSGCVLDGVPCTFAY